MLSTAKVPLTKEEILRDFAAVSHTFVAGQKAMFRTACGYLQISKHQGVWKLEIFSPHMDALDHEGIPYQITEDDKIVDSGTTGLGGVCMLKQLDGLLGKKLLLSMRN